MPEDGGWRYLNPPENDSPVDVSLVMQEAWTFKSELQFYKLMAQGPTRPYVNKRGSTPTYERMQRELGGTVKDL